MDLIEYGYQFLGVQETQGPNRGPLVDQWKGLVGAGLKLLPIPWCACFVFAMLVLFQRLTRRELAEALGFSRGGWFPESTRSWQEQGRAAGRLTTSPRRGDIFLLLRPDGTPHHTGFLAADFECQEGVAFPTLEGNTNAGGSDNGDGVYQRSRVYRHGVYEFYSIPQNLKFIASGSSPVA